MTHPIVQVDSFSAIIGKKRLLNQIDLEMYRGEWVGLTGRSGAGKSLLGKSLAGLAPAELESRGQLRFRDRECSPHLERVDPRKKSMSYMPQDPSSAFNPVQRIGTQVDEVFRRLIGTSSKEARKNTLDLLSDMKFEDPERMYSSYPHEMSGGQAQRALLSMLAAKQPELFILDEPTTDLDLITESAVLQLVRDIATELKAAVLFITHDISVLGKNCSRILFMEEGRMEEEWKLDGKTAFMDDLSIRSSSAKQLVQASEKLNNRRSGSKKDSVSRKTNREPILAARELTREYKTKNHFLAYSSDTIRALDRFTYRFYPGRMYGILGRSGSGKSTLASLLSGMLPPTSGQLIWREQSMKFSEFQRTIHRREGIQLIYQNPFRSFDPTKTMHFSLREASDSREITKDETFALLREQCAVETDWLNRYPHELSGGQLQRLAVLRALLMQPLLLLADESTSALDTVNQLQLMELLDSLTDTGEMAMIICSHQIQLLLAFCDEILVLKDGRLIEYGTPETLEKESKHPFITAYKKLILD